MEYKGTTNVVTGDEISTGSFGTAWFLMPSRWARFIHRFGFHDWMPMYAPPDIEFLTDGPNGEIRYKASHTPISRYPAYFICLVCKNKKI
jgi:hypothetical protein